ncbi:MAG: hypothetical protein A2381_15235 [Bdellovibrionales bacterium RIFOXYB1_FULL_37_110]|nr:MAG: hypothetical protein A2381_15235 [Bdellovibrionales bacterium RIFOXYB1_FULL_37_110]
MPSVTITFKPVSNKKFRVAPKAIHSEVVTALCAMLKQEINEAEREGRLPEFVSGYCGYLPLVPIKDYEIHDKSIPKESEWIDDSDTFEMEIINGDL